MYNSEINKMIMTSMKSGEKEKAAVYRLLKSEFLKFTTAKNAKPLDDAAEIQIIRKMVKERQESEKIYLTNNRQDLADNEKAEYLILETLLPQAPSNDEIDALMALGYSLPEAREALNRVPGELTKSSERVKFALKKINN